jgi:hypothetical protein
MKDSPQCAITAPNITFIIDYDTEEVMKYPVKMTHNEEWIHGTITPGDRLMIFGEDHVSVYDNQTHTFKQMNPFYDLSRTQVVW